MRKKHVSFVWNIHCRLTSYDQSNCIKFPHRTKTNSNPMNNQLNNHLNTKMVFLQHIFCPFLSLLSHSIQFNPPISRCSYLLCLLVLWNAVLWFYVQIRRIEIKEIQISARYRRCGSDDTVTRTSTVADCRRDMRWMAMATLEMLSYMRNNEQYLPIECKA